jgi:hypothetical protein
VFFAVVYFIQFDNFKLEGMEIEKSLAILEQEIYETDKIYVFKETIPPFIYYKNNYPKVSESKIVFGTQNEWNESLDEIERLDGTSWLIMTIYSYKNRGADNIINDLKNSQFEVLVFKECRNIFVYKIMRTSPNKSTIKEII